MKQKQDLILDIFSECAFSNLQIITVESCTGGLVAAELTKISGSSKYFDTGYVTYSNQSKINLIKVPQNIIEKFGAVSAEVVSAMAKNVIDHDQKTNRVSIAVSGVAGPEKSENKPIGLVWLACYQNQTLTTRKLTFGNLGRNEIRQKSVSEALKLLHSCIIEKTNN